MKYYLFLLLTLLFSVPFYIWGAVFPVTGLPFGLPISFLMIFVPFVLSIAYSWRDRGSSGVVQLFTRISDYKKAESWAAVFCLTCMPVAVMLSYFTLLVFSGPLPQVSVFPFWDVPIMLLLYFLGAIPEELGWTMTLTHPLTAKHGPGKAGAIIGLVWALWHVIPWSWAHDLGWISGMIILNILIRIGMVFAFTHGGASLFYALVFHTMINVSMGVFPNYGSHTNPGLISFWMLVLLVIILYFLRSKKSKPTTGQQQVSSST